MDMKFVTVGWLEVILHISWTLTVEQQDLGWTQKLPTTRVFFLAACSLWGMMQPACLSLYCVCVFVCVYLFTPMIFKGACGLCTLNRLYVSSTNLSTITLVWLIKYTLLAPLLEHVAALPTSQMQNQGRGCHFWRTFYHFHEQIYGPLKMIIILPTTINSLVVSKSGHSWCMGEYEQNTVQRLLRLCNQTPCCKSNYSSLDFVLSNTIQSLHCTRYSLCVQLPPRWMGSQNPTPTPGKSGWWIAESSQNLTDACAFPDLKLE